MRQFSILQFESFYYTKLYFLEWPNKLLFTYKTEVILY